jgi:Ca-activated chloride channel family protein
MVAYDLPNWRLFVNCSPLKSRLWGAPLGRTPGRTPVRLAGPLAGSLALQVFRRASKVCATRLGVRLRVPIVCAAFVFAMSGQEEPTVRFNADTSLVLIPATVTDSLNRFVLGLHKEDFHLLEDGAEQTIAHFSGEDAPLSVGLIFDTSGSMGDKLRTSRQAAFRFLETMNSQDEVFLVEFGDKAELAAGFTSKVEQIEKTLTALQPGGLTAMLDGAEMALREMKKAKNPRKAIVIISDGGDNNSKYSAKEIQALVRQADVQIYAMGIFEPSLSYSLNIPGLSKEEVSGPRLLAELAEQTGGRAFTASNPEDLPSIATRIGIELRNQYVLAYSPSNKDKDGKYRKVEVKVTQPASMPGLKLRWRLGYYAPQ